MKVSDYIAQFIVSQGTKDVFLVTGGAIANVVDAVGRRRDKEKDLNYICVQHEQAAAMAVETYSRLGPGIGVALATSGPGATNFITGICGLWFDSIPGLFITGQVSTTEDCNSVPTKPRQIGFQETDIVSMVKSITKYANHIKDAKEIRYELEKAVWLARNGRPGPVLLDIPVNIQTAEIDPIELKSFVPDKGQILELESDGQVKDKIKQIVALLGKAQRPLLLLGGGIRVARAEKDAKILVEKLGIPVVLSWSGFDLLDDKEKLLIGEIGVYGDRGANFAIQNCDLLLNIGSRLDTRQTGGQVKHFARAAKKVCVDIDRNELHKNRGFVPEITINTDAKKFIELFLAEKSVKTADIGFWLQQAAKWKKGYPALQKEYSSQKTLSSYVCVDALTDSAKKNDIVIVDSGGALVWSMQGWKTKSGQRVISTMGNSPMGYAVPASIGATVADQGKSIICIAGDGAFQLNIQELQTICHYKLPIKMFILNNRSMGIIKQFQDLAFGSRRYAVEPSGGYSAPDFVEIAKAYKIPALRIKSAKNLRTQIQKILKKPGPFVCDLWIDEHQQLNPKLEYGKPLEDMYPYLSDKELQKNMLIPQLPREERKKGWITIKN